MRRARFVDDGLMIDDARSTALCVGIGASRRRRQRQRLSVRARVLALDLSHARTTVTSTRAVMRQSARRLLLARIARNTLRVYAGELTPSELLQDARTEARRRGWLCKSARASKWAGVNAAMRACGWSVMDIQRGGAGRVDGAADGDGVVTDSEESSTSSRRNGLGFVEIERSIIGGRKLVPLPMLRAEDVDACGCTKSTMCARGCENAAMNVRCDARVCVCGVCKNTALYQLAVPHTEVRDVCGERGSGLFAVEDIPANVFCGEYVGELLTAKQAERRQDKSYMLKVDANWSIDARRFGNKTRYINHKCSGANIVLLKFTDACTSFDSIGLFSRENIKAGSELTMDYGIDFSSIFECACGAARCKSRRQVRWLGGVEAKNTAYSRRRRVGCNVNSQ